VLEAGVELGDDDEHRVIQVSGRARYAAEQKLAADLVGGAARLVEDDVGGAH
jgi:hypothetical protein